MYWIIILTLAVVIMAAVALEPAVAAEWPAKVEVGGFTITDIKGTTEDDGSGRAVGKLALPGGSTCSVDLTRTASGIITGSTRSSFMIGGVRIDGSFLLDRRGLQGTGTIHTQGRPVSDANISITPKAGATGNGQIRLGTGFSIGVNFKVTDKVIAIQGSTPRQASEDTPLADYTFKGSVDASAKGTAVRLLASGNIERKGKIGGMISTFGPVTFDVDPSTGEGQTNVGGTNIVFDLW